jgi:hypothetical protein
LITQSVSSPEGQPSQRNRPAASGIDARHPDEFLLDQLDLRPSVALEVMQQQAADIVSPPLDLARALEPVVALRRRWIRRGGSAACTGERVVASMPWSG